MGSWEKKLAKSAQILALLMMLCFCMRVYITSKAASQVTVKATSLRCLQSSQSARHWLFAELSSQPAKCQAAFVLCRHGSALAINVHLARPKTVCH